MAERVAASVLGEGLRIVGRGIRDEPAAYTIAAVGAAVFGLGSVAGSLLITHLTGQVIVPALASGSVRPAALGTAAALIVGLSLIKICGIIARRLGAGVMQVSLQARYRRKVTRRYLELPLAWHRSHATGTLLSNANADVEAIWFPISSLPLATGTLAMIAGAAVSLLLVDWSFALVGLAVFPTLFVINIIYARMMSPRIVAAQALRAHTSAVAHESFDGALVVKTMGREWEETERFAARARQLRDAMIRVGRLRGFFDPLIDALPAVGSLAVLVVGLIRVRQGAVTVADVVGVAFLFTVLAFPIRAIGWVLTEMPRSKAGWDRVQAVLAETGEMTYGRRGLVAPPAVPAALRLTDVTFSYSGPEGGPPGSPVLHEVCFEVPAGRTVALVGATGSGKSTLAALAARLVDPDRGEVSLDGIDVRELSATELTATVALVPQLPFIFDDTIRGNIDLGRAGITDADVVVALSRAQADGFVRGLPEGLDTAVGERGTSLSGGQRQRLTLARALAGHPRLLILDDATSAVDPRVEAAILRGLRDEGSTILVVAYRRATIALADEVVYLEHGRVVARGPHPTLLATVPGYADLVTAYERAEAERQAQEGTGEPAQEGASA